MEFAIYATFIALAVCITASVYIERTVVYGTLRRYGVDPDSRGWVYVGSRYWLGKYKEICDEHGLSLQYWRFLRLTEVISGVLVVIFLILAVVVSWHDILHPMSYRLWKILGSM